MTTRRRTPETVRPILGATGRGRRAERWILTSAAILVLTVAGYGSSDRHTGSDPASGASATGGSVALSAPPCLPKFTESGFSVTDHVVHYGVIARSDCPQAAIDNVVSVRVLDAAGKAIDGQNENVPELAVLLPGQQVAGAGTFYTTTVSRVDVEFTASDPAPVSALAAWPTSVHRRW